ncbi:hypothetical protein ACS0TY_034197 [Phlomoides rotata]
MNLATNILHRGGMQFERGNRHTYYFLGEIRAPIVKAIEEENLISIRVRWTEERRK